MSHHGIYILVKMLENFRQHTCHLITFKHEWLTPVRPHTILKEQNVNTYTET